MKKWIFGVLFFCSYTTSFSQRSVSAPLNDQNHFLFDRLQIISGDFGPVHSVLKPLMRKDVRYFQDSVVPPDYWNKNKRRQFDFHFLKDDSNDDDSTVHSKRPFMKFLYPKGNKSFLRHFYRTPAHLLEARVKNFFVCIDPLIHFKAAFERFDGTDRLVFFNRRGVAIRGNIAQKVYFYSYII